MKKYVVYSLLVGMFLYLGVGELSAQNVKLDRWVFGSGGVVGATNSADVKMNGIVGQFAVERIAGTTNGRDLDIWQGFWVPTGIITDVETPGEVDDNQLVNYPNPVSNLTTIRYSIPGTARVSLKIYNVSGNLIKVLVDGIHEAGMHEMQWDVKDGNGEDVSSGSYLYELTVNPAQMAGFGAFQPYTLHKVMVVVK